MLIEEKEEMKEEEERVLSFSGIKRKTVVFVFFLSPSIPDDTVVFFNQGQHYWSSEWRG